MFYSETLLLKKGPLARVWLAANLERKLSKAQYLQASIEKSVGAIVGQDVAPMALRLSGQLLLGVVRIYGRKAKYLLDDCNEALIKLRMTFSKGNVDLTASATAANPQQLTLPNTITDLDLLNPDPSAILGLNAADPFAEPSGATAAASGAHTLAAEEITLPELQDSIEYARGNNIEDELENMGDDDLVLDTGEYLETSEGQNQLPEINDDNAMDEDIPLDMSIEIGRDNEVNPDQLEDYALELGDEPLLPPEEEPEMADVDRAPRLEDMDMSEMEMPSMRQDDDLLVADADQERAPTQKRAPRQHRVKIDTATELRGAYIKDMQENRTGILKTYPTLPYSRDTVTLIESYESQGVFDLIFKPTFMNEALSKILEPELLPNTPRKRKSSNDGEDAEEDQSPKRAHMEENRIVVEEEDMYAYEDVPVIDSRFDLPQDDIELPREDDGLELDLADPFSSGDINAEGTEAVDAAAEEEEEMPSTQAVNGISRNTKEAVAVLVSELSNQDKVDFQSLTVDKPRSKAVKLFFETLVLATKDAIEVEQKNPYGLIDISAKDALFGNDWIDANTEVAPSQVVA
ncbi:Rec8 like protein-domain-containing protein [Myxozyma melibiosi]|uniref:Rec8 like protein-domain-containing protein n=1 Tax=Myxozyma melibiosi TaxID=54550 RepID=A0ABR1F0K8_9ASCO